jgi:hypothetical protein
MPLVCQGTQATRPPLEALTALRRGCGELSTGEYHAQYERSSGWVWTGGLAPDGPPYTTLKQTNKLNLFPSTTPRFGAGAQHRDMTASEVISSACSVSSSSSSKSFPPLRLCDASALRGDVSTSGF